MKCTKALGEKGTKRRGKEKGGGSVGGGRKGTGREEIAAIRPSVGIWKHSNFDDG